MTPISNFQIITGKAPVFLYAEVGNVAADKVIVAFNKTVWPGSEADKADFAVAGTSETISTLTLDNHNIILTMSGNLLNTDVLTVSYTQGSNPVQDSSGNESVDLVTEPVINNI